jgi:chemosensory pili system protein ChpA (sensor histidine kinase/response regulator)
MLEDELPAVMLLDIEMPRMDGFEVTQHMRSTPRLAEVPIIMITSRTADKHRDHALELGVNAYMGKPYQEEDLLAEISRLVGVAVA